MKRFKVFFCSPCFSGGQSENTKVDPSFNQTIDVSHLATPHVRSNKTPSPQPPSQCSKLLDQPDDESAQTNDVINKATSYQREILRATQSTPEHGVQQTLRSPDQVDNLNRDINSLASFQQQDTPVNSQPSSPLSTTPTPIHNNANNNPQQHEAQIAISSQRQPPLQHPPEVPPPPVPPQINSPQQPPQPQPQHAQHRPQFLANAYLEEVGEENEGATRLSYDIISVREPLAKILAERQRLLLAQQQQKQAIGDHEYIEVYGERGSSCFYEEIAGSITSSATYDQIGTISNHNYQALINAYAVASRPAGLSQEEVEIDSARNGAGHSATSRECDNENLYDVTAATSGPSKSSPDRLPNNARQAIEDHYDIEATTAHISNNHLNETEQKLLGGDVVMSQSIPVYSVINKATRRSNSIIRAAFETNRPPRPPPKNLVFLNSHSISSNSAHDDNPTPGPSRVVLNGSNPSGTTYAVVGEKGVSPKPPPRLSKQQLQGKQKQQMLTSDRPLPRLDNYDCQLNDNGRVRMNKNANEDFESANNGYESLKPGDEDQVDVGYEKIRESNRYSGGSLSSQFCSLQIIDNGGYESVQPIYSSPSNALAEPNYEAIGPSTASELAAAATAKLTAAATLIEQNLKQDQ